MGSAFAQVENESGLKGHQPQLFETYTWDLILSRALNVLRLVQDQESNLGRAMRSNLFALSF